MTSGSHDGTLAFLEAPIGGGLGAATLAALLSDFSIVPGGSSAASDCLCGVVGWADLRQHGRLRRRAAALGVPFLRLGPGLLRAPPGWGRPPTVLSATAHISTGPTSPADFLDPGRLLATRDWLQPELLARAAQARRDIVSRRLAGPWWNASAENGLPPGNGRFALIVAGEGAGLSAKKAPSPALLRLILSAALVEHAPHDIILLVPDPNLRLGFLRGFIRDAVPRGCTLVTCPVDPWEAIERSDCVYTVGGETGFLALLAGAKVRCFSDFSIPAGE